MDLRENIRIIWAVAAKDIGDALKNKTTLSIMLGVGVMMLTGLALPLLFGPPRVPTTVEGHVVYPSSELGLQPSLLAMNLTILLLVIGLALAPHLMIEEKETHTFDALLVSPARFSHVVSGKALAGLFYCLCAAVVVFLFNTRWIVHWEIAALAFLLGAAFAVAAGLLLGIVSENPATINLWVVLLLMLLLVPMLLEELASAKLPEAAQAILPWMPSVAIGKLVGFSMVGVVPAMDIWSNVGILAIESLIFYALVIWRVHRLDR